MSPQGPKGRATRALLVPLVLGLASVCLVSVVAGLVPPNVSSSSHKLSNTSSSNRIQSQKQLEAAKQSQVSRNLSVAANNNNNRQPSNSLVNTRQRWRQMEMAIATRMESLSGSMRATLDAQLLAPNSQVTAGCRSALGELLDGIQQQSLWATQMLDASARLPSGILTGTLTELGNYDQCVGLSFRLATGQEPARGQYCSVQVKPMLMPRPRLHTVCQRLPPLSGHQLTAANQTTGKAFKQLADHSQHFYYAGLRLGICTPSKCSRSDVQLLLSAYLSQLDLLGQVKSCQGAGETLQGADQLVLDPVQQCIACALILLLILVLVGTVADYATLKSRSETSAKPLHPSSQASSESLYASLTSKALEPLGHCDQPGGPGARRWLYQVYRPPRGACPLHHNQQRTMNLQRNPLHGQFSTLQSCSHLFREPSELTEEASWLVDLDQSSQSQVMSPASLLGSSVAPNQCKQPQLSAGSHGDGNRDWASTGLRLLICFSLHTNLKVILGSNGSQSSQEELGGDIGVIHGLRAITMVWIIFGHSIGLVNPEMMNNLFSIAQLSCSSRLLQALLNATLAVNTFFMISGLVTVISLARKCSSVRLLVAGPPPPPPPPPDDCKPGKRAAQNRRKRRATSQSQELSSSAADSSGSSTISSLLSSSRSTSLARCIGPTQASTAPRSRSSSASSSSASPWQPADFKPLAWLLLRFLRLAPAYATVLAASILLPALGSGPFWQESAGALGAACRENWWLNLLFVNNFINTDKLCLIHSWYLSNDWQFFTLTLVLLAIFYKSQRLALLLLITCLVASTAANFAITVANDFPPTIVTTSPVVAERWLFIHSLYYKPWPHLPSYLVGLITGYLMLRRQHAPRRPTLGAWASRVSWLAFTLLALALLNSVYPWNMGLQVDPVLAGLHSATFRTLWAVCCARLVYALTASASPKNWLAKLLSWHGFQVSSRLTYCLYLVHPLIIYYHFGSLRERLDSSPYSQFHRFAATLATSYLAALSLTLMVEGPALKLLRLLGDALGVVTPGNPQPAGADSLRANSWNGSFAGDQQTIYGTNSVQGAPLAAETQFPCHAEQQQRPGAVASLDADFQKRLAQAISRGFRVRSRLANSRQARNQVPANGAASRRAPPVNKWPAAVPPPPPPLTEWQATDKSCKRVEFSTFATPNTAQQTCSSSTANLPPSANQQQRRRSHQDLIVGASEPGPNLASLNHQILAQHQKLLSRPKDQL